MIQDEAQDVGKRERGRNILEEANVQGEAPNISECERGRHIQERRRM